MGDTFYPPGLLQQHREHRDESHAGNGSIGPRGFRQPGSSVRRPQVPLERAIKWMTNKKSWKDRPQSKMFMKLFRYIAGVNKDSQEIEMTVPVWSKMVVNQEDGQITKDMCFYITKEFQSNPPEPVDPEVKILKSKERVVFVKQFVATLCRTPSG